MQDIRQKSIWRRLSPFLGYLWNVKWTFILGLLAGILYGITSGLGLPLLAKYILPILFNPEEELVSPLADLAQPLPNWLQAILSPVFSTVENLYGFLNTIPAERFLLYTCITLPLVFFLRALGGFFNQYLISKAGLKVLEQVRASVFQRLQELSLHYFQRNKSGEIITKLQGASEKLRSSMMSSINDLIIQPVTLIGAVIFIISQAVVTDGALPALVGIIGIPLALFPILSLGKKVKKKAKAAQEKEENLSSFALQNIQSPLEVRAYNLQEPHQSIFQRENNRVLREILKTQKYTKLIPPVIEVLAVIGLSAAIFLGVKSGMSLETFTALAVAIYMAYEPVKKLGKLNARIQNGLVALDRLESILYSTDELPEKSSPTLLPSPIQGDLSFHSVGFSYAENEPVLSGIQLDIKRGEAVALVGPSGSGKTTFMSLVGRLYDPTSGHISLDGVDLRELSKKDLRNQIAIVPQMPTLFNLTIRENISVGNPEATLEEIQEAAKHAYAHEFIMRLPDGYETMVSEAGTSLSGGQRQRISIARAFLKDAPILLLDEATSALDNKSQEKITRALKNLMEGKTVLMIAHRESSLTSATRRLSFLDGKITEDINLKEVNLPT